MKVTHYLLVLFIALMLPARALGQHEGHQGQSTTSSKPKDVENRQRTGDPYWLPVCPISGEQLGSMGDPSGLHLLRLEGRVIVRSMDPDSAAAGAGVQPRRRRGDRRSMPRLSRRATFGGACVKDASDP